MRDEEPVDTDEIDDEDVTVILSTREMINSLNPAAEENPEQNLNKDDQ